MFDGDNCKIKRIDDLAEWLKYNKKYGRVMAASVEIGGCCSTGEILASRDQRHGRCTNCGMLYIAHIKWILESIKL